ncbi:type II secretion system protein GspM [Caenimonas terrae]|uniref:Type II secretion system protein GspM n=1 Tax=Caenimonas terrae TaxID=696074 RepID=A0ABW0NIR8_9BURK
MRWNIAPAQRSALALAFGFVVFIGGLGAYVYSRHVWAQERLAELEPRYARLVGLGESGPALDTALAQRRAFLARHAYPLGQDVARAGSDALQRARETMSRAGLDVSTTQVLAAKEVDGFDRIPLMLRMEGELPALQSALTVLPSLSPSLFIESFTIQTIGMPKDGPQRLSLQANLFVLRSRK